VIRRISLTIVTCLAILLFALPAWATLTSIHTSGATAYYNSATDRAGIEDTLTDGASVKVEWCLTTSTSKSNCTGLGVKSFTNSSGAGVLLDGSQIVPGSNTRIIFRACRNVYGNCSGWVNTSF